MGTLTLSTGRVRVQMRTLFPGVLACAVVAAAASFLAEHYGAPVMLFALLLGLAPALSAVPLCSLLAAGAFLLAARSYEADKARATELPEAGAAPRTALA